MFFDLWVVDQHAVHKAASKVATAAPNFVIPNAGQHTKIEVLPSCLRYLREVAVISSTMWLSECDRTLGRFWRCAI
jgi:hypothetical protein